MAEKNEPTKTNREIFDEAIAEATAESEGSVQGLNKNETKPDNEPKTGADQDKKDNQPASDQQDSTGSTDNDKLKKTDVENKPAEKVETNGDESANGENKTNETDDDMPVAMARKFSDKWKGADAELRAEVVRVLNNDQQTIARFKAKNKSLEDAISIANPDLFADVKRFGITKEESLKNRLAYVSAFQRNPDETFIAALTNKEIKLNNPAGLIRAIANISNLNLETLTKVDPKIAILEDKNAAYEARKRAEETAKREQEEAKQAQFEDDILEEAKAFVARHPEVVITDLFKKQMDYEAAKILEKNPNISNADLFENAYAEVLKVTNASPDSKSTTAKKEIPIKRTVGVKGSDDAGEGKITQPKIDVNNPDARQNLFKQIAKTNGLL